jgi:hypothetical protein
MKTPIHKTIKDRTVRGFISRPEVSTSVDRDELGQRRQRRDLNPPSGLKSSEIPPRAVSQSTGGLE